MKIGIDARMYGHGFGLARYVEQLVKQLQKTDQENQYVFFLRKDNFDHLELTADNFKKVLVDIPWYSWREQLQFKSFIKKQKVDLMHFPHWNVPLFYKDPFVLTIHDLIMFHFPRAEATTLGPIKFWIKDKAHRLVVKNAVKNAKHILVTSEFTKNDVHKTLNVPLEKMTVTYQAPFKYEKTIVADDVYPILTKFGINKPYILYVGSAYPHKNLEGLLKAWKIFKDKYGYDYQMVFVGADSYFYQRLLKKPETAAIKDSFIFTGLIGDYELCALYRKASLYVFPSFYEGFGLPPLEAMSYGVPVASSNFSCLPEVLGEAALYFDPESPEQMADVIYKGLTDKDIVFELKQKAVQELQKYSNEKLVEDTLRIYNKII